MAVGLALMLGFACQELRPPVHGREHQRVLAPLAHLALDLAARLPLHPARRQPHGPARTYVNLLVVMLLGGLWHGATWNFVVWGAIHGACWPRSGRAAGRLYSGLPRRCGLGSRSA